MGFNLVRFGFQVVNFLVLVWLLKRFLYKPIRRAMDARAERIRGKEREAEEARAEAEAEKAAYREKVEAFEAERARRLERLREEVAEERKRLLAAAREEADDLRRELAQTLEREKDAFVTDASRQVAERGVQAARRILEELAGEDLEARIVDAFGRNLEALEDAEREAWAKAVGEGGKIEVRTAFDLPEDRREAVVEGLRAIGGPEEAPAFILDPGLVCGIAVTCGGERLGWSVDGEIERLRAGLDEALEALAGSTRATAAAEGADDDAA